MTPTPDTLGRRTVIADLLDRLPVKHSTPLHPRARCRLHCGADLSTGPCRGTGAMRCKPPLGPVPDYIRREHSRSHEETAAC